MTRASGSLTAIAGFRSGPGRDFDGRVGRIPLLMSLLLLSVVTGNCAAAGVAGPASESAPAGEPVAAIERVASDEAVPASDAVPADETVATDAVPANETVAADAVPADETVATAESATTGETVATEAVPADDTVPSGEAAPDSSPVHRYFPLPFVFYQPETRFGGGVGLLHTIRTAPEGKTSNDGAFLVLTERKQFSVILSTERYVKEERYRILAEGVGARFPDYFYGIGNTTDDADEESFTAETAKGYVDLRKRVRPGLYAGLAWRYQRTEVEDTEDDGMLRDPGLRGSRGGTISGPGAVVSLDTRDRSFGATRGANVTLWSGVMDPAFGSDFAYARLECDARTYRAIARRGTNRPVVVAAQAVVTTITGSPPFFDLANLGGANMLRGIYEGRFRERNRAVTQVELRAPLWRRLGTVAFLGAGQVAHDWGDLNWAGTHVAGGLGFRILLSHEEGVALRLDIGAHEDGSGVYFALGDAF